MIDCEVDKEICQQNYADLLLHQDPFIVTCHIFGGWWWGVGGRGWESDDRETIFINSDVIQTQGLLQGHYFLRKERIKEGGGGTCELKVSKSFDEC